jgi:hypothetical protein
MVAGAGMKLMVLCSWHSSLDRMQVLSHGGWHWIEADDVDLLLEFLA